MEDNRSHYPYHLMPTAEQIAKWQKVLKTVEQKRELKELMDEINDKLYGEEGE